MTLKEEFQTRNFSMHLLDAIDLTPVRFANPAQASTDNGKLALTFASSSSGPCDEAIAPATKPSQLCLHARCHGVQPCWALADTDWYLRS
ncbi:hypothetical protein VDGD_21208 [Verticillium dahliae]|nr:hypothetical protein VDGD_21208 [Verticillium dahliae]